MHTVELLEELLALAAKAGYTIRQEWLGGSGGGLCEIAGRRCFFLDLALDPQEQVRQLADALRQEPGVADWPLSPAAARLLRHRRVA